MDLTEIICKLQGNTSSYFWLFVTLLSLFVKGISKLFGNVVRLVRLSTKTTVVNHRGFMSSQKAINRGFALESRCPCTREIIHERRKNSAHQHTISEPIVLMIIIGLVSRIALA